MITYVYVCRACGHQFEREQRITDQPIRACPDCGREEAKRVIVGSSFILKGKGWAADGYR